jgi:Reverse transcriptase (RNA-dependent DNA polymerase)
MSLHLIKPSYPFEPIKSIPKLSLALGFEEKVLIELALNANSMYRKVLKIKGSKVRETYDAQGLLKKVHRRIKNQILARVSFPAYLHGSLKGCDYVTNAALHTNKKILICEDVKGFFPSISAEQVTAIWRSFFHFSEDVAILLTSITTKDCAIPQGAITSSYLANLVFWKSEPYVHAKLAASGIIYSRYVDDIAMSSDEYLSKASQTKAIAMVYGMLIKHGLKAARNKHEVFSDSKQMKVTKLIVNRKPSLSRSKRSQVRAQTYQAIKQNTESGSDESKKALNRAKQSVGQLGRFHPVEANKLKQKLKVANDISL